MYRITTIVAMTAITAVLCVPAPAVANAKHGAWTQLISRYVSNGLVDYEGLASERAALDAYLTNLAATPTEILAKATRNEQLAFWINAYNAFTLKVVCDNYPIQSINDLHRGGLYIGILLKTTVWDR